MSNKYLDIALEKIIKQEINAILDKIRAEIVEEQSCWREDADAEWYECRRILRIIDNYKAERG